MKQLVQVLRDGSVRLEDVPVPELSAGCVRVRNVASIISAGTERMKVETGKLSLIGKARARPDQVRKVLDVVRQQGLRAAFQKVQARLDRYAPMGYSCAGVVEAVAPDVEAFRAGDRVACAGQDLANHAEIVVVPERLVVRIPDGVAFGDGAFATIGAIALQSLRQARPELGETVLVIGLGLLGQLVAQLARAGGARVIGVDVADARVRLAESLGVECALARGAPDLDDAVLRLTDGHGVDAVVVTASTSTNDPVVLAHRLARDRARVVFLGNTRIDLPWNDYYHKELTVLFSRSYGAGRYDRTYEEQGVDYPIGYARWTIQRNMQAFLAQVLAGRVALGPLVTHRFPFLEATKAYDVLTAEGADYVALALEYGGGEPTRVVEASAPVPAARGTVRVGLIGAGNFAQSMLLPPLARAKGVAFTAVATRTGTSAKAVATRFGFARAVPDGDAVCADPDVDLVLIATRHGSHARYAEAALRAGKQVYVEKPLALDEAQLEAVVGAEAAASGGCMVGFNRRFAPLTRPLAAFCAELGGPLELVYRVNAGSLPPDHWYFDAREGGGRIIGEACHFVDYLAFLAGHPVTSVSMRTLRGNTGRSHSDNATIVLAMADGSVGTVHYFADGDPSAGKELVEVFGRGGTAVLDNFQRLELTRGGRTRTERSGPDKGHAGEMAALVAWVRGESPVPVPFAEAVRATRATFAAVRSGADNARVIDLDDVVAG